MSWKKSALVRSEIFRLFINTITADDKYSRNNMQNLQQRLQAPLSQKEKTFFQFVIAILKCAGDLEHFQKKHEYSSLIISEIIDTETRGYLNV